MMATNPFMFAFIAAVGYILAFVVFYALKNHEKAPYIILAAILLFFFPTTVQMLFFVSSFGAGIVAYVLINKLKPLKPKLTHTT